MNISGTHYTSIWFDEDTRQVKIIDQTQLPHFFRVVALNSIADVATAITTMQVRGAPLIGATAAFGIYLAIRENSSDNQLEQACAQLLKTRPTAVNLHWAINRMKQCLLNAAPAERETLALQEAQIICKEDIATCQAIGIHGLKLIEAIYTRIDKKRPVNILTHCNAGWLATVDWGTALAPIYAAYNKDIPIHVWVDETRPRNQGASLTAFELVQQGIPHTLIVDNVGGHLMQHNMVDLCIVGSDRTTSTGDVANKIGTYLKALAASDNGVPFYVALPVSTIDWALQNGIQDIPIEQRDPKEVTTISGIDSNKQAHTIHITPPETEAVNYGFDVTPARLITGLITERGIVKATVDAIAALKT